MKNGESRLCTPSEAPEKQTGLRPQSGFEKGGAAESGGLRLPRQLASDGYEPVSYTHLDVYKRQSLYRVLGLKM